MRKVYRYLEQINSPEDLKKLKENEVRLLAHDIRKFLVQSVSKTGGHLASNLGVVELTLALHTIYDTLKDKIIWDVGHQAYVHKILTGRREQFKTLRQYKGLSGFPKRHESSHDHFDTGHSSTSISAALGLASARDLKKEKHEVVAVIGDGALTGGMAFEALNHGGQSKKNITVVLNDNEMSISQNVGGLSNYLSKIRTAPIYAKVKDDLELLLGNIPAIGKSVKKTAEKAKDSIKYFFVPGILFEELGFTYIGPIDGHDYNALCTAIKNSKNIKGPKLIHVITKKGKGYKLAEKSPAEFHGVSPFKIETGKPISLTKNLSFSEVAGNTLIEAAKTNPRIVTITAAMPSGTGLADFAEQFPERFFDVGIAEQHAVTFAAGMAAEGYKPFFAVYSTFLQRAFDQVIHDVCIQNLPVTFLIDRAGLVGNDGETHHGVFDISFLSCIPNLTILAAKDGNELQAMIQFAEKHEGPVAIRYPRGTTALDKEKSILPIQLGKGEVICDWGKDALILTVGNMNEIGVALCQQLNNKGIGATVINPRFIKPIDQHLILQHAKSHKRIYVLEDNAKIGGFGEQIRSFLNEYEVYKPVKLFALPDAFIEQGNVALLYKDCKLNQEEIFTEIYQDFTKGIIGKLAITR
ncbi:deoxyxylulose-5-phosphate synthase [Alkaliphilus metalliredigens QYMF]|uniref:1-deoxy-D-xylulose-5-phosphate synthase n=1 Tax=Alkaliphilus metalliredigens (strain QYMF) TaxID=293826 RepID=A6TR43_ALKMQ|nr:1-deoxy-D-xylulose-5-phosphate synthase [Alkaliphilus metalliredigens]ABR48661.1 deoxyxylulose-5-phosphate synthase [Alkaliphilus metalliredigens QYMF]